MLIHWDKIHNDPASGNVNVESTFQNMNKRKSYAKHATTLGGLNQFKKTMHYEQIGIFIIDAGRCTIVNKDSDGKGRTVSTIGRNDSFGGAGRMKISVSLFFHFTNFN